jgi:hypothetical protein
MFADPVPLDEDDPEVKIEMFEQYMDSGIKPEDLTNAPAEWREEYAVWLQKKVKMCDATPRFCN